LGLILKLTIAAHTTTTADKLSKAEAELLAAHIRWLQCTTSFFLKSMAGT